MSITGITAIAPAESFPGETKIVAATETPEALVDSATPCRSVWIGPPCAANGDAENTKPVFIGDENNQNIPILPTNFEGIEIEIDDAAKVFVKVGVNGEKVVYRTFLWSD